MSDIEGSTGADAAAVPASASAENPGSTTSIGSVAEARALMGARANGLSDGDVVCAVARAAGLPSQTEALQLRYTGALDCSIQPTPAAAGFQTAQSGYLQRDEQSNLPTALTVISALVAVALVLNAQRHSLQLDPQRNTADSQPWLSPYGRIGRREYAKRVALLMFALFAAGLAYRIAADATSVRGFAWLGMPAAVAWAITSAKRLRDAGKPTGLAYLQLVPIVGLALAVYCALVPTRHTPEVSTAHAVTPLQPTAPHEPAQQPPNSEAAVDDEGLWALAAEEIDQKTQRPGLWARAYAEAMGDDAKARAIYLALRVEQLKAGLALPRGQASNLA